METQPKPILIVDDEAGFPRLLKLTLEGRLALILYLLVGVGVVIGTDALILLIVMNQRHVYMDLLSHLLPKLRPDQEKDVDKP